MSDNTEEIIGCERRADEKYNRIGNHDDGSKYFKSEWQCKQIIRKTKLGYEVKTSREATSNPKLFLHYVRGKKTEKGEASNKLGKRSRP